MDETQPRKPSFISMTNNRFPSIFSTRKTWPAPLGVTLFFASQIENSGDFCTTSDARSRVLMALRGMIEILSLGVWPASDAAADGPKRIAVRTATHCSRRRFDMAGILSGAEGLKNCQVIWREGRKEARRISIFARAPAAHLYCSGFRDYWS